MEEINKMKPVYYANVSEENRTAELDKRVAEGESDLRERMEKLEKQHHGRGEGTPL